jgi:uncharacterized membrane protein (UPF0182 family)
VNDHAPRRLPLVLAAVAGIAVAVLAAAVGIAGMWAEVVVKGEFYDAIGLGPVWDARWPLGLILFAVGVVAAALALAPVVAVGIGAARALRDVVPGAVPLASIGFALVVPAFALAVGGAVSRLADRYRAFDNAAAFGRSDPIFGRDIGFYMFELPFLEGVTGPLLAIAVIGLLLSGGVLAMSLLGLEAAPPRARAIPLYGISPEQDAEEQRRAGPRMSRARGAANRAEALVYVYGGLLVLVLAARTWYGRYDLVTGGDELIAGAGEAVVSVAIPTRAAGAVVLAVIGALLLALAIGPLRRRARVAPSHFLAGVGAAWIALTVTMMLTATVWWWPLLLPAAATLAAGVRGGGWSRDLPARLPPAAWAGAGALTAVVLLAAGTVGAALYDAVLLRGSKLQVEREYLTYTLEATRQASGVDAARVMEADYRRGGVDREDISSVPASLGSLRFLDQRPALAACSRTQTFRQFYVCADADIDRYAVDGGPQTTFVMGREIDYSTARLPDFQRRHFTYTHGYGLIAAPVNRIDEAGRPEWIAGDIPQRGFELDEPALYFGARPGMPWTIVNTRQPVFDETESRQVRWEGTTGIRIGSGLRRFAITKFLGGLPYVGGGRRIWNATGGDPAGADSQLLLYRDAPARARELAPFLRWDDDPYFVAADGRVVVMMAGYAASDRYPYAVSFAGARYMRMAAVFVMDAYSGETTVYAIDEDEPVTRTWSAAYPELFTPLADMPESLQAHLRYGEDLFDYQSEALERFHVSDTDTYYNGDEAWAPTEETAGYGVEGVRVKSPARYTYAVMPGSGEERFILMRSYKPAVKGRGIGFSGWLAVDSEPDRFGEMVVLRFPENAPDPLDSLDTFTSNIARDPNLSQQITTRAGQVLRGNTIVVPVGEGLLYVQPLYLDTQGDSLPTLWQVVASFGDGRVHAASTFEEALERALQAQGEPPADGEGPGAPPAGDETIEQLVARAAAAFDAYQQALAEGRDEEAFAHYRRFREALEAARDLAEAGGGSDPGATAGTP